ncbi:MULTISPECIES: hypothetical protein [unclassified Streptococcus]|uniref:hypothetical protein n=1 Tax=unclassified Streptococcus TaxID=2608887 RepID=UPI000AFBDAA8|nr:MULTISPECIES: hypothetical protein [unclassified Streptococcus]
MVAYSAIIGNRVAKIITTRNMALTVFAVVVTIAFTYIYLMQGQIAGLFAISGIALSNGIHMRQRPNLQHHLIRMGWNIFLLVLLYLVF